MVPATSWDGQQWVSGRGWTVMGTLRQRQHACRAEALAARDRQNLQRRTLGLMTPAAQRQVYEDAIKARWRGGPTVLAFLFAPPDTDAMHMLDMRGEYFDQRTGDTWDLFFPGYYVSTESANFERETNARPVGHHFAGRWYFNASDFNMLRQHVEQASEGRWQYSGGTDLVLVGGWLVELGEPTIDWVSTISGQVTDRLEGARTLTLAGVVERITRDLETASEDPGYGVGQVTAEPTPTENHVTRDFILNALAGIAAALGARHLGA